MAYSPSFRKSLHAANYNSNGAGATQDVSVTPVRHFALQAVGVGGAATAWTITLQGSLTGSTWENLLTHATADGDGKLKWVLDKPVSYYRVEISGLTLGGASAIAVSVLGVP